MYFAVVIFPPIVVTFGVGCHLETIAAVKTWDIDVLKVIDMNLIYL